MSSKTLLAECAIVPHRGCHKVLPCKIWCQTIQLLMVTQHVFQETSISVHSDAVHPTLTDVVILCSSSD